MDNAQFVRFTDSMAALRVQPRTRRPEPFSSGDGAEWLIWRQNFEVCLELNEWNTQETRARAKNEALASITGEAKRQITELRSNGDNETVAEFLNRIQARYLPEAATQFAKAEYDGCSQLPGEKLINWHGRLRVLFVRAFPAQAANAEQNEQLIRKYMLGLTSTTIKTHVLDGAPATYADALARAQNKAATEATVAGSAIPGGKVMQIGAIDTPSTAQANRNLRRRGPEPQVGAPSQVQLCWSCGKAGHYSRECRSGGGVNAAAAVGAVRRGRGRFRGARAGRGQSGGRRGRGGNPRRIGAIDNNNDARHDEDGFVDVISELARDIDENPHFAAAEAAGN